jgi:molybdate transport system substrate-binding protein
LAQRLDRSSSSKKGLIAAAPRKMDGCTTHGGSRMKKSFRILLTAAALTVLALSSARAQEAITVFAAASLKNVLDNINTVFTNESGIKVTTSYESSSSLTKQIEQGAPADVLISADLQWMDYANEHKLIKPNTRFNLLGNRLVLIVPKDSKLDNVAIGQGFDLAKLAGDGRIAVADVRAVPAGRYAKAALEKLGTWAAAEPKLAQAENVRATLVLVARGETEVGIVYETDAKVEPRVKIVGVFPEGSYPPVTYPIAETADSKKASVSRYLSFLRTNTAKEIFEKYGFNYLIKPTT